MNLNRNRGPLFDVQAQIKAEALTGIFDGMTKNMKEQEKIFFIFSHREMKIWMCQNSKSTQLELKIAQKAFKSYDCNFPINKIIMRKYELKKFLWFSSFFQSCKGTIKLTISEQRIELQDPNNVRKSIFPVMGEQIDEEEKEDLQKLNLLTEMNEKSFCTLCFNEARIIKDVIHSGNAIKPVKLYLSYLSNKKKLRFDFYANEVSYLKVKAQEKESLGSQISKVALNFSKLKLATSLMEKEKAFKMTLSKKGMLIHYDEEHIRNYSICLLAEED